MRIYTIFCLTVLVLSTTAFAGKNVDSIIGVYAGESECALEITREFVKDGVISDTKEEFDGTTPRIRFNIFYGKSMKNNRQETMLESELEGRLEKINGIKNDKKRNLMMKSYHNIGNVLEHLQIRFDKNGIPKMAKTKRYVWILFYLPIWKSCRNLLKLQ